MPIVLSAAERRTLQSWSRLTGDTPPPVGDRARIILMAASGSTNLEIAHRLDISKQTVCKWRMRFVRGGLDGLGWSPR